MNLEIAAKSSTAFLAAALCTMSIGSTPARAAVAKQGLQRLYILMFSVSDAAPFWFDYILDIRPDGRDVRMRIIRISPENAFCRKVVTVKATEALFRDVSLVDVVNRRDLCALEPSKVGARLRRFANAGLTELTDEVRFNIVVTCGSEERVFELPFPDTLRFHALERKERNLASLWDLYYELQQKVFGDRSPFYDLPADRDLEQQQLGGQFVPELRSGVFDRGLEDAPPLTPGAPSTATTFRSILEGYIGPHPALNPASVEMIRIHDIQLNKYVAPIYPPIALWAHTEGRVEVEIAADSSTGSVREVRIVSGPPLLLAATTEAIQQWSFAPTQIPLKPVRVALEFKIRCPVNPRDEPAQ